MSNEMQSIESTSLPNGGKRFVVNADFFYKFWTSACLMGSAWVIFNNLSDPQHPVYLRTESRIGPLERWETCFWFVIFAFLAYIFLKTFLNSIVVEVSDDKITCASKGPIPDPLLFQTRLINTHELSKIVFQKKIAILYTNYRHWSSLDFIKKSGKAERICLFNRAQAEYLAKSIASRLSIECGQAK